MLRWILPVAVVLLGIAAAAVMIRSRPEVETRRREVPPPLVRVVTARARDVQLTVAAQGTVTPRTETALVAEVAGRVVAVSPSFVSGGYFDRDDVLIEIDAADYRAAEATARSQVAQAELRVAREEQEAAIARRDWQELGEGAPTPLALREPQLAEARAGLEAARAALERAQRDLERTRVLAPYDGRVRGEQVDVGQFVGRGTVLGTIYAIDVAEVRLPLPDRELAYLDLPLGGGARAGRTGDPPGGPTVLLHGSFAGRTHTWTGTIVRTEGELDPRSRMVHVVARVDDPYGRHAEGAGDAGGAGNAGDADRPPLAVGLYVNAEILGRHIEDVYVLPRAALRGSDRVIVVDDEDRLRFRQVEVVKTDRETAVVRSGLADGDRICLSTLDNAVDGMRVRTTPVEPPPESEL
ncbi:MAG: efflux RND transporter periplasmic adaptor subunit [Candidatus Eiseniibacteriota bacterium]|jgi:RND family efflux transporter MFP subunit